MDDASVDSFFGCQGSDGENVGEEDMINFTHSNDITEKKSQHGTLSKYEIDSLRKRFRTSGYHETYNKFREERLQEGFEKGYRNIIENAIRIGIELGENVFLWRRTTSIESNERNLVVLDLQRYLRKVQEGENDTTEV